MLVSASSPIATEGQKGLMDATMILQHLFKDREKALKRKRKGLGDKIEVLDDLAFVTESGGFTALRSLFGFFLFF